SIMTNIVIVEQEQNGMIAPNASPLTWLGTAPPAIQLCNRSGPKSRFIIATASEITRNSRSRTIRTIVNVPSALISINDLVSQGGVRAAGALSLRGQRRQVR